MRFKPKEVLVNLPVVLSFSNEDEIVQMATAFNTFIHGKVKMKYEILGMLGEQFIGLFYLQRNNESQQLRDEFMKMIEDEEIRTLATPFDPVEKALAEEQDDLQYSEEEVDYYSVESLNHWVDSLNDRKEEYDPEYGDDRMCLCGHTYYRHFDSHDEMAPVGCKYCNFHGKHEFEKTCPYFCPEKPE